METSISQKGEPMSFFAAEVTGPTKKKPRLGHVAPGDKYSRVGVVYRKGLMDHLKRQKEEFNAQHGPVRVIYSRSQEVVVPGSSTAPAASVVLAPSEPTQRRTEMKIETRDIPIRKSHAKIDYRALATELKSLPEGKAKLIKVDGPDAARTRIRSLVQGMLASYGTRVRTHITVEGVYVWAR